MQSGRVKGFRVFLLELMFYVKMLFWEMWLLSTELVKKQLRGRSSYWTYSLPLCYRQVRKLEQTPPSGEGRAKEEVGEREAELRKKVREKEKIKKHRRKERVNVEGQNLTGMTGKVLGLCSNEVWDIKQRHTCMANDHLTHAVAQCLLRKSFLFCLS